MSSSNGSSGVPHTCLGGVGASSTDLNSVSPSDGSSVVSHAPYLTTTDDPGQDIGSYADQPPPSTRGHQYQYPQQSYGVGGYSKPYRGTRGAPPPPPPLPPPPPIPPETVSMNIQLNMQHAAMQNTMRVLNVIRNNNEAQQFLSRGGQVIIRMRGLPYDCTAKQVIEFFDSGENPVQVVDNEDGVLFVKKPDGRATGDAFVLFATEDDSTKALAKHREIIGSRYIELFRSTTAEVQQVLNRSMDPRTYEHQQPLIAQLPQMPLLPQQVITSGTRKDCIRLRGLPYEAQVEHILEFLGENAKSIVFQGVHMVYNAQGQPSGEAFIQMDSEHSAFLAAQQRHHRYMVFGKKQRYIEVFQCSGEDMNFVLTGGIPAQRPVVSPGMLMWDGAAALQPGAHSSPLTAGGPPGPQGPHHPLHGTGGLPPPHHHGHVMPGGIPPTSLKQHDATLLIPPHLTAAHNRPPMGGQHLDLPHSSAAHGPPHPPPTLLSPMKAVSVSAASTPGFPSPLVSPYDTMAGQPNMLLLSGGPPRLPITTMAGAFTPQVSLMSSTNSRRAAVAAAAASAKGVNGNVAKTPMGPPLLPLPYSAVAAASASVAAGMRIPGKRSFEQAFPGDPSAAVGGMKRLPQVSPHFLQGLYPPTQMFPAM